MVASAHALASQAGLEMLKAGGNAVDAAVAAAFAIGVVEPNASGIGGEGMMVIYLAGTGKAIAIDYRSAAPASVDFPDGVPDTGHAAAAIPGTVAGLTTALQKYGTMPLSRVLAPAIRLAGAGLRRQSHARGDRHRQLRRHQEERTPRQGAVPWRPADRGRRHPEEPRSRRRASAQIAEGGADVFYKGALADAIVSEMAARGGRIIEGRSRLVPGHRARTGPGPLPRVRRRLGAAARRAASRSSRFSRSSTRSTSRRRRRCRRATCTWPPRP